MTDTVKFRAAVKNRGLKYKYLAEKIGITPFGLQKKIENQSEFKASEIQSLAELLGLTESERKQIFFTRVCD